MSLSSFCDLKADLKDDFVPSFKMLEFKLCSVKVLAIIWHVLLLIGQICFYLIGKKKEGTDSED